MAKIVNYDVTNLMIPAFGNVQMITNAFNPLNTYRLDINTVLIDSIPFRPQSVTLDCSSVPAGVNTVFEIEQIKFRKIVTGGNTSTFNFPSIPNMVITVTPANGSSEVRSFFYNFPSFTDTQSQLVTFGSASGALPVAPVTSGVFTQSNLTVISAGVITIPANANRKYLLIQNKDTTGIVYVNFSATATVANGFAIQPGGSLELAEFVPAGAISLIGSIASNGNVILAEGV